MEEKLMKEISETAEDILPIDVDMAEFKRSYAKLSNNRSVLCSEDGNLRPGNERYRTKYLELLNLVAKNGTKVLQDMISHYYIPKNITGSKCCEELTELLRGMSGKFKSVIKKGTIDDFMKQADEFSDKAADIYLKYIIENGMHEGLIA